MDPSDRWTNIAPVSDEPGMQRQTPDLKKRRRAVAVACIPCRNGKSKCDGTRPVCTRCRDGNLHCHFDVPEGVSRAERMKILKRDGMSGRAEDMERIVNALRSGTDMQASTLLARLRLGERVENIATSLPATSLNATLFSPPSLLAQDSTGTSGSCLSQESTLSDDPSSYRHSSNASLASSTGQRPNWPPANLMASSTHMSSVKGKQPMRVDGDEKRPFLSIIFNREDFLLAMSDSEDEDDSDEEMNVIFAPSRTGSVSPSGNRPRDELLSSRRDQSQRSIHATHLRDRQPVVSTLRIHPNFDLRNLFGNLPFSSSVLTNNHPPDVQGVQVKNLFLPTWAMMTINTLPDPGSLRHVFSGILQQATEMIRDGVPLESVIETHPNIAALFDEAEFDKSGILSQWAAGMVHSATLNSNDFTCCAYMYCIWYLMRWMISPSPETYRVIPEWLRPTPNQLFMPHITILDFVLWPAFRELAAQIPAMQQRMEWLMDYSINLHCDWSFPVEEAFRIDEVTGRLDLCDLAKTSLRDLSNWSLRPSFRGYVSNADSYVRIRTDEC
ncbi:hypothetical protein P153DRAFT_380035 [Dothidotthia symphoricarpi CBS 119687]|uniref:Zn(2)-C6 fungal-type domain-containing protein n=1 Tax=Dothidotthia symphoricarpi CBS 119687 TaxID=1392245 RepID=A0A6A5ZXN8_9PLEO|nr:uncharacterized protein P153DRAFT_380035 [Dothidotthia symphoricarpi CBS 119687]KAF2123537.1 hypothetical protein P153DRAFT_380035 [Dothidotthia symphoricarpi CBS 119687]